MPQTAEKVQRIILYTDGGCRGNPGPGAWAALSYLEYAHNIGDDMARGCKEIFGSAAAHTTNNQMELQAVIKGLQSLQHEYPAFFNGKALVPEISVYTDSQYVKDGITKWIHNWKKNAWRKSSKEPVKNKDLWQELDIQTQHYKKLRWHWVKGHAGNYYNERCDELVQQNLK